MSTKLLAAFILYSREMDVQTSDSHLSRRISMVLTPIDSNWNLAEAATSSFAVSWELKVWVRLPHASASQKTTPRPAPGEGS